MNQTKRKLKINMLELEDAFEGVSGPIEMNYYLDLETGQVILISSEDRSQLEKVYETYADSQTGRVDFRSILPLLDLQDAEKEFLLLVDQVEDNYGTRYLPIPQTESREGYQDMVAFIETVANPRLQSLLERAIQGKGAFRYFKDVLRDTAQERERWFQFSQERQRERIRDWLESEDIELIA